MEKEKHTISHVAASEHAMCHADISMMSARGQPYADVIMAFDDVSVDLVSIDQVNQSAGPRPGGVHMSVSLSH